MFLVCFYCFSGVPANVQYNGGLLPDIILLTPMLFPSGNSFKCHEEVLYLQPLIPAKRFDIFSLLTVGCSEGLDVLKFFFKSAVYLVHSMDFYLYLHASEGVPVRKKNEILD